MLNKKSTLYILFIGLTIGIIFSCSTEKNTTLSRTYHNITSHYNVFFNANESFKSGMKRIESSYVDDYSKILKPFKIKLMFFEEHA